MLAILAASTLRADVIERTMAIVEGRVVLLSDVQAAIELGLETPGNAQDPTTDVLRQLIERELILAEVERYVPPAPSPVIVAARVDAVRARFDSSEAFEAVLRRYGLAEAQLVDRIRDDVRIEGYLDQRFGSTARPTDEAVLEYYREHRADFIRPDRTVPLAEASETIRSRLAEQQRQNLIREWIDELRRRATILAPGLDLP